jgi:PPR repeat family
MPFIHLHKNQALIKSTPSLKHLAYCYQKARQPKSTTMNGMSVFGRSFAARQYSSFTTTRSPFSTNVSELGQRLASGRTSHRLKSTVAREPILFSWAKKVQHRAEAAAVTLQKWTDGGLHKYAQDQPPATPTFDPPKMSTEARNAVYTWVNSPLAENTPEGFLLDDLAQQVRDNLPSMVLYTYMLNLCAHSNQPNAGRKALKLLNEMYDKGFQPTSVTYSLVLDAWARAEPLDAGEMTKVLWKELHDRKIAPSLEMYKASIGAWAKSGAFEAGEKAEELVRDMQANAISPTAETYTLVIQAWARAGVADGYKKTE